MKVSLAKRVNGDGSHFDGVQGLVSLRLRKVVAKVLIGAMLVLDMPVIPLASADTTGTWVTVPISADPMMQNLTIPADAATKGMWSAVQSWPLNGLHTALLPDGRVLSYGTSPDGTNQTGKYWDIWDSTLGFTAASHKTYYSSAKEDSFCSTSTFFSDGRLLISGGNGATTSTIYTPSTNTVVTPSYNLALQRWYATMISLPDGRPIMMGGMVPYQEAMQNNPDQAIAQGTVSMTPEVLETTGWRSLFGAYSRLAFGPDYLRTSYPKAFVAPNGLVFGISAEQMWYLDPAGNGTITSMGTFKGAPSATNLVNVGTTNNAVMYAPGKIVVLGGNGGAQGDPYPGSKMVTSIDINGGTPVLTEQQPLHYGRRYPSSIVLANGEVVVTGGSAFSDTNGANAVYVSEIWNPSTGVWRDGASAAIYRGYHSISTLMPNGTILSTGGGTPGPVINLNAEIYYPPYLFKSVSGASTLAPRPVIQAINSLSYANGDTVQLDMTSNATVSQLVLIGASRGTHAFNAGQRRIPLTFTQQDIRLSATIPDVNTVPPGYYQVVALDANGVPSLGALVGIGSNVAPPPVPTTPYTPPDLSGIIPAPVVSTGGAVSYTLPAIANTTYSWNFGDGTAATAYSASPSISYTYTSPGVYGVTLSVKDVNGIITARSFLQAVATGKTALAPTNSTSILTESRGSNPSRIWVVNPDNDSVGVIDSLSNSSIAEIAVGKSPRSVAIAPNGNIWVTNKGDSTISVISPSTLAVVSTIALPRATQPHGLAFSPNGNAAYVVLEATGQLLKLDPSTGAQVGSTTVGNNPRHLSVSANGATALVSRFITPPLPGESTLTVDTSTAGGEVLVINTTSMAITKTVTLKHSDKEDTSTQGAGIPNYLAAAVISPDGGTAWVPSKQDNIKRGMARSGQDLNFQNSVRAISSRIDLGTLTEDYAKRVDHDNSSLGSAAVYHASGDYLFVALETSRQVAIVDAIGGHELLKVNVGIAPQGLALSTDGNTLYVQNFMDRTVSVLDLTPLTTQGILKANLLANVSSITTEKLPAAVLAGKQLFYDAKDTRLARDSYMSCASCHSDAGHDGRVWDFTGFGEGLRNTIALKGRAGMGYGFVHWSANFDEIQDFEKQIRVFAGGTGLMTDAQFNTGTVSQPLGTPKAGISVDLDNLAAYVGSLNTFAQNPNRNSDGSLTASATAGKTVFASSCASCHGGTALTISKDATTLKDIGTINALSGQRLGATLTGLDVPTLRDAWATAPYLHNGSASTITAAVQAHNNVALNVTDIANVVAYVQQIGSEEVGFGNLVSLSSPTANATYTTADSIPLAASATDTSGTITKVEFYDGTTLINTTTTSPYTYSWTSNTLGSHTLTAKSYSSTGSVTTSAAVNISIKPTAVPPANATVCANELGTCTVPAGITATVWYGAYTTTGFDGGWLYQAGVQGAVTCSNSTFGYDPASGLNKTCRYLSNSVIGTNVAPTVALTAPANNASYTVGDSIVLTATATEVGGTVAKVDFYDGTTLLNTTTTAPYTYTWAGAVVGTHTLTAVATDAAGAVANSSNVSVKVTSVGVSPVPTANSVYCAGEFGTCTLPAGVTATVWFGANSSWNFKEAVVNSADCSASSFGGDPAPGQAKTCRYLSNTVTGTNAAPTVSLTAPISGASYTAGGSISLTATAADTDGTVAKVEFYDGATLLGTTTTAPYAYTWATASVGSHSLTAKATDNAGGTTTSAVATVTVTAVSGVSPTPPANATACSGEYGTCTLPAGATATVWYGANANWLYKTNVSNSLDCRNSTFGGDPAPSQTKTCMYLANTTSGNVAPTVSLTAPTANASYTSGISIAVTATAADSDGTVTKVDFYDGATLLGTSTTAPYAYTWNTASVGSHSITAKATDNSGAVTASGAIAITVTSSTGVSPTPPANATTCAGEYGTCTLPAGATATVWYGANTSWLYKTGVSNSLDCRNSTFGSDPAPGLTKSCMYLANSANVAPTVSLTAPAGGASFASGVSISLTATATDSDGTVTKVEFYDGATLIGSSTTAPYAYTWTTAGVGSHSLTAKATDNSGAVTTSAATSITVAAANVAPTVSLTAPAGGASFASGASISLTATAADTDGTVTKVEFYDGATLLSTSTTAPYAYTWTTAGVGSHSLTAKATDNKGAVTTSAATSITVAAANVAPTVSLTAPAGGASFSSGTSISLTATATDTDGTVAKVEFYDGATLLSTSTTAPYAYTWTTASVGSHSLTAKATDNSGAVTTSAAASITVAAANVAPTVSLTAPAGGASFSSGTSISITATAADSDGTVTKVDFYDGATLLGTSATAPYAYTWTAASVGSHSLTAKATDNSGAVTTSAAVTVMVAAANVAPTVSLTAPAGGASFSSGTSISITATAADSDGTVSKVDFYDGATLLGTSATAPYAYTWTAASVGSHSLTAKAIDNSGAVTTSAATSITVAAANVAPTVSLTAPAGGASFASGVSISLTATATDSDGTVTKVEFYDGATLIGSSTTAPYAYTWTTAGVGSHSLTAKATDNSGAVTTSAATSITVAAANVAPTVSLTAPAGGASFASGASISLTATAADTDGTVTKVEFYDGATLLSTSTTAPYAYTWTTAGVGSHSLTAKATDNKGAVTTSAATSITVAAANVAPTVSLTAPAGGASFSSGTSISLTATATDTDGTVAKVEFYDGATLLSTSTTAPYAYTWTTASVGSHSLTAKATDNSGAVTTSAAASITVAAVSGNVAPTVSITSPVNVTTFTQGAAIKVAANAADSDGTVAKVEFYDGATLLGTSTTAPYAYTWTTASVGSHSLTAKATDNTGATTTTAAITVTLNAPTATPPSNSVTCASEYGTCTLPAGTLATVWYGANSSWLLKTGVSTSLGCSNGTFGSDPASGVGKSCKYLVVSTTTGNVIPTVSLTSPAANASYAQGASMPLQATATDVDGSIAKVEFYDNGVLINTATTAPYSYSYSLVGVVVGTHIMTAKTYDNSSTSGISPAISVTVTGALPANTVSCAGEYGTCTIPAGATATVWYGANNSWYSKSGVSGGISCTNGTFGGDPASGATKACRYLAN